MKNSENVREENANSRGPAWRAKGVEEKEREKRKRRERESQRKRDRKPKKEIEGMKKSSLCHCK